MNRWIGLALAPTLLASTSLVSAQVNVRAPFVRVQVGDPGVYVRAPFVNIGVPYGPTYYPPIYGPVGPPVIVDVPRSSSVLQLPAPPTTTYSNPQAVPPQVVQPQIVEPPIINPPAPATNPPAAKPQTIEPAPLEILPNPRPKVDLDSLPPQPINPNPPLEIQPAPVPAPAVNVPTHEEFARSFQPKAGLYEVTLRNPITGQPNQVRFSLPEGTPRVEVFRRDLEFRYPGRQFVRIEFDRDGAQVISR